MTQSKVVRTCNEKRHNVHKTLVEKDVLGKRRNVRLEQSVMFRLMIVRLRPESGNFTYMNLWDELHLININN